MLITSSRYRLLQPGQFLYLLILLASIARGPALAAEKTITHRCSDIMVEVISTSTEDHERICTGAQQADAFFASHGIKVQHPIRIQLHESAINQHPAHIGLYDSRQHKIDLLSYRQALEQCSEQPPFDVPMCEPIYRSFVVHEISHAIVDQNLQYRPASLVAQEYLAYAAQFDTMDEDLREKILQGYDVEPFDDFDNMSVIYYELDPNAFGVKAFLHYQSLAEPGRSIRDLLSGELKPAVQQRYWW